MHLPEEVGKPVVYHRWLVELFVRMLRVGRKRMEALAAVGSGFQLSRGPSTNLPALASSQYDCFILQAGYEASLHMSSAASLSALWTSSCRSQRSSTCSTVSKPCSHSHAGLSARLFLNRHAFSPQCSARRFRAASTPRRGESWQP